MNNIISLNIAIDKYDMKGAIAGFSDQIKESFKIIDQWDQLNQYKNINSILVLGMGGSAIGGDVAKTIAQNSCNVPFIVNRSYSVPKWVDKHTLVIVSSYSGVTEETLSAYNLCKAKDSKLVIISSGGTIIDYANKYSLDRLIIPKGLQPRAALGYSFSIILLLLNKLNLISDQIIKSIYDSIEPLFNLSRELQSSNNNIISLAEALKDTCPIIYGSEDITGVAAFRFRCQLAENAKILSFHHHFPEQNHNEIEGWTFNKDIIERLAIVWLTDKDDHFGVKNRMKVSSELLKSIVKLQITINQSGNNSCIRLLKLIHYLDWLSYYIAILKKVDPTPVERIQKLKSLISR